MTDLEMTRLCAEAMGMEMINDVLACPVGPDHDYSETFGYDPIHDDAQAMALVKKMTLDCYGRDGHWDVWLVSPREGDNPHFAYNKDLNRAIVECVAKMQAKKVAA